VIRLSCLRDQRIRAVAKPAKAGSVVKGLIDCKSADA
jgi:hypothetical protein